MKCVHSGCIKPATQQMGLGRSGRIAGSGWSIDCAQASNTKLSKASSGLSTKEFPSCSDFTLYVMKLLLLPRCLSLFCRLPLKSLSLLSYKQYAMCRGAQGINQGWIHPCLPILLKILSLILFSPVRAYSNEKHPGLVMRVLQVTSIPELHQHCSWGRSSIYFVALRTARVPLFPHHHIFAPPGSSLGPTTSSEAVEIPSTSLKIIYIFCAAAYWLIEGSLNNRRKLSALSAFGSILQPSQLTWAQGLR